MRQDRKADNRVAPALDLLSDDYQIVTFIGHAKEGSPYQGPPNAEVDAIWDRLTTGNSPKLEFLSTLPHQAF